MKAKIEIETQTFVRFWLVMIGFVLAAFMIYSARTGLIIIGAALFLALALNSPVSRLSKLLPGKSRIGSTLISFLAIVVLIGTFVFLAVPPIIQQTAKFAQTLPALVDTATSSYQQLDKAIDDYNLRPQVDQAVQSVKDRAAGFASNAGSTLVSSIGSLFGFIASLFLTLVLAFLMLVEGPTWMKKIWGLYRDKDRMTRHRKTTNRMVHVVSGYVTGQLVVAAIGAVFTGLTVFIISLFIESVPANLAVPAAAITFITSLIPLFGSAIGATIIGLLLVINSVPAAIAFLVFFVVYQQIENNFVSPAIQSRQLELSPLLVLSAVTIGIYVFGIVGAIISIPIAGCIKVLTEEYLQEAKRKRNQPESKLHKLTGKFKEIKES
jgi:predicted PurR-regulated permease PerM